MSMPMSERQFNYLRKLIVEREYNTDLTVDEQVSILDRSFKYMKISSATASLMIDRAKTSPVRTVMKTRGPVPDGIYFYLGDYVKVLHAVNGSGRQYTKKFNRTTESWDYTPGLLGCLVSADRLTEEQAKEFGALYGRCVVCGRTLTDEESIEYGIGPVCRAKTFS
jgi:hypothetical protein